MKAEHNGHEHEFEPEYGLPERLPARERLIWQGSPDTRLVFREVFHARGLAVYFGLILLFRGMHQYSLNASWAETLAAITWLAPLFLLALGLFWALSWLVARTTVYTITDRRVVMRVGIVLSLTFNIPLKRLQAADVRRIQPVGAGEIALQLLPEDKIAYFHLWPHARPWRFGHPEPMLRGLAAVDGVAALLHEAWAQAHGRQAATPVSSAATPTATPTRQGTPAKDASTGFSGMETA
ncbi:MAG: photosynthetic complex putative assembly protein PuhB [Burkholderiaceae bacterium]